MELNVRKSRLDNGLSVLTFDLAQARTASLGIWVQGGARLETRSEEGMTHFAEHMAFKGTRRRTATDVARETDRLGGRVNAFTTREQTCFHAGVVDTHVERALDLLADIVLQPVYDPVELERERKVILQEIRMVEDQPEECAQEIFQSEIWPDHPMGWPILGSFDAVSAHPREALLGFLSRNYVADRMVVAAAGRVDHDVFERWVAQRFDDLAAGDTGSPAPAPAMRPWRRVIERDTEQAHVLVGVKGPPRGDARRYALCILDSVLGGSMNSRLFQEVREKRGLAYNVYSFFDAYADDGLVGVYMGVEPDSLAEAVDVAAAEMRRLASEPVTSETLEEAKDHLKGNVLLGLETSDAWLHKIVRDELDHHRFVPPEEVIASIDAVSVSDVMTLAAELFRDETLGVCALGPVEARDLPAVHLG